MPSSLVSSGSPSLRKEHTVQRLMNWSLGSASLPFSHFWFLLLVALAGPPERPDSYLLNQRRNGKALSSLTGVVAYPLKLKAYLLDILRREAAARQSPIQTVVIHRGGRVWPSELEGTRKAFEFLKREGPLAPDVTFTVLKISKSSSAPLRLFDVRYNESGSAWVKNPQVGAFYLVNEEGYLCSTGWPFLREDMANPLHVKLVEGLLPLN